MSTPSTLTALHPQQQFYPHYPDYSSATSSQRPPHLPLPRPSKITQQSNKYHTTDSPADRQLPPLPTHRPHQSNAITRSRPLSPDMSSIKREKKADWGDFYKNGLPKEIIVIDDSSPEKSPGHNKSPPANSYPQHDIKRRRTDGAYDAVSAASHSRPPQKSFVYEDTNSSGTNSSGRNTSAVYSTAPTSLTSTSSAAHQMQRLDDTRAGQKRKRLSRVAQDEESPELEVVGQNQAWTNYVPPAKPPIKAPEVYTPVVRDVSDC